MRRNCHGRHVAGCTHPARLRESNADTNHVPTIMIPYIFSRSLLQRGLVYSLRSFTLGALALSVTKLHAGSFTQGHVVVQQAAAAATNTTLSLVEVDTGSATTQSSPVQTITLPGTNYPSNAFRINGSGGTTGYLMRKAL